MPKTNYFISADTLAMQKLAKWIKRQTTQKELAAGIGISPQMMSHKLKHLTLTADDLLKIFHYLGTPPDEIAKIMTY